MTTARTPNSTPRPAPAPAPATAGSDIDTVDVLVAGAGVVGLAIARSLAAAGMDVVVAERESAFGTGVSSRNSEVVHAGIYYPPGSARARLCVRGKHMLYAYCAERGIAHRRCGKLIVATRPDDQAKLDVIKRRAEAAGVPDLQWLTREQARALEPELECAVALLSPSSGIVDSHGLMTALLGDAQAAGAVLAVASPVERAVREHGRWRIRTGGAESFEIAARWLVNAAGLDAQAVAAAIEGFPAGLIPARHLARGHYFSLAGRAPFQRLIYPTPVDGGLGVHLTLDLGGQARFGPDVQWIEPTDAAGHSLDYAVDPARADAFYSEIRRYWPRLADGALLPAYTGIRPKLSGPGQSPADFRIDGPADHGVPGVVQLFGIESPGLTSSLAIADEVCTLVTGH